MSKTTTTAEKRRACADACVGDAGQRLPALHVHGGELREGESFARNKEGAWVIARVG